MWLFSIPLMKRAISVVDGILQSSDNWTINSLGCVSHRPTCCDCVSNVFSVFHLIPQSEGLFKGSLSPSAAEWPPAPPLSDASADPCLCSPAPGQPLSSAADSPNAPCRAPPCPVCCSPSSETTPAASAAGSPDTRGERGHNPTQIKEGIWSLFHLITEGWCVSLYGRVFN